MANIDVVDKCGNLSSLIGTTIRAFHHGYTSVALLDDDGDIVNFCTDEVSVGKWFEVFPIELTTSPEYEFTWTELKEPFLITGCAQLWREEWQEPVADNGSFLGAGPHFVQCSAPIGNAPNAVSHVVQVNAGVSFSGSNESCMDMQFQQRPIQNGFCNGQACE
jgi:hypothetical protein